MNALAERIRTLIEASGPISVADYMTLCLSDPEAGYYTTRDPFGQGGDFVTAPEISQMFGELVGVWCIGAWTALGRPKAFTLCEIGPGRGTLMADLLRTTGRIAPDFLAAARVRMIETSPRLAARQQETLADAPVMPEWVDRIEAVPGGPLILVANELFDALPIRQYVKHAGSFRERAVGVDDAGGFVFGAGVGMIDPALLPAGHETAAEGTIFEASPARTALMDMIATRIAADRGAALLVDYGHLEPGFGDTLQAVLRHEPDDVFAHPGEADLTSHVDFAALALAARAAGCRAATTTQGQFLLDMGLLERAGRLGAGKDDAVQDKIRADVERLAAPGQMGDLFKVLCVADPATRMPPFISGLT